MAATIGATLSGVTFPDRHAGLGPFKSSAGAFYFFGRDVTNVGHMEPHKATDPMSAFTAQTTKLMSSAAGTSIQAAAAYQVSDVIHVAAQISTGAVYFNQFNMATDAWVLTTSETAVAAASQAPATSSTFVSLVVRSGGEVVIAYCAGQTAMSSTFNMIRYVRRNVVTFLYSGNINIDNGGSVNWLGGIAVLGASDRVHFFFTSGTANDGFQRTLSAANALETFPAAFDTQVTSGHPFGNGTSYVSGGTTKVRTVYGDAVDFKPYVASLDSADAPTVSKVIAGDNVNKATNNHNQNRILIEGTNQHIVYIGSTDQDLYHDVNSGAGWGTDTNEWTATLNVISANVYERNGTQLAMVVDDGGTIKYAEIQLVAPPPPDEPIVYLRARRRRLYQYI